MREKGAILIIMISLSNVSILVLCQSHVTTWPPPMSKSIVNKQSNLPQPQTLPKNQHFLTRESSLNRFINDPKNHTTRSEPTYLNLSALRSFLAECKLADGEFMERPLTQGIPISDTWATFLIAWTSEFVGLRELVGTYRGRSPLDYFAQLATPASGFWNSTLTPTVTVFSTALAFILWHNYPNELSLSTSVPGEAALTFILDAQDPLGGYAEPNTRVNLFTTALALQALAYTETQPHNPFTPRTYIQSLYQSEEGRFDDPALDAPGLWETWYGLWAAHLIVPWKEFPEVNAYIMGLQQADGSWGTIANTFVAIASLELLGELNKVNSNLLLAYVKNSQYLNESSLLHGGFKDSPPASSKSVSSINTAYALYILHVLEGIADEVSYSFSTDQTYYIQGESATTYVEASYGDESLEALTMAFTLVGSPIDTHERSYDATCEAYWHQIDTTSLFAIQTIEFSARWEPTFLSPQIRAATLKGTFVVGYDIDINVDKALIEPGMSTNYTVAVANLMTAIPYPVNVSVTGPAYRDTLQFTTAAPNGTTVVFSTMSDILLGTYQITANLTIPNTNMTRSAQAVIEIDTSIEAEVEGLKNEYIVGDPFQMTIRSWYNSSQSFPNIPLTVRFNYQGVVSWATDPIYGIHGIYPVNITIPVEPILGEVMILGIFHFPDFEYEVPLGTTSIRFTLTVDRVQVPEVAYLARPLFASYIVSSTHIPAENLTDFQSYVNLTATEQFKNQTFSRLIETSYQNGRYELNWTVEPNLPTTVYNLTILFRNPFGETTPAFHTTIRFEEVFHLWVSPDFSSEVSPGDQFQLYFTLYWTDDPDYINLREGTIGDLELEATSPSLNISSILISFTTLTVGTHSLPGYGLSFTIPKDTPKGVYHIFIYKSRTGEYVTTVEAKIHIFPFQQHFKWILLIFVATLIAISLVFVYVGFAQWRFGRPERIAQRFATQETQKTEHLSEIVRSIDRELQQKFKDPIMYGWPRKREKLLARLQSEEAQSDIRAYLELEKRHETLRGTFQHRLREIQKLTRDLIELKMLARDNEELHTLRVFHGDPLLFVERYGIQALQHLAEAIQQFITGLPTEDQTTFQPVLHLFTDQAVKELRRLVEELDQLHQDIELLKTSEECEEQITRYLERRTIVTDILRLQEARQQSIRELNQLKKQQNTHNE